MWEKSNFLVFTRYSIKRETITLNRLAGESLGFDVAGTIEGDAPGPVRVFVQKIKHDGIADRSFNVFTYFLSLLWYNYII